MPLRLRLALAAALITAGAFAVAGGLFLFGVDRVVDDAVGSGLQARSRQLVAQVRSIPTPAGAARRPVILPPPAGQASTGVLPPAEDIRQVLGADGRVLAASSEVGARPLLSRAQRIAAAGGPVTVSAPHGPGGGPTRLLAVPARTAEGTRVVTVVGASTTLTRHAVATVRTGLLIAAVPAIAAAGVGGWALAGAALAPVERMRRRAQEISEYDEDARLPVPATGDELAALAGTLNDLLARLQDALGRQRTFVADTSHELRGPLTALRAELELAARPGRSREELTEAVTAAVGDTARLVRLVEDLLLLSRTDRGQPVLRPRLTDVEEVVSDTVWALRPRAEAAHVTMTLTVEPLPPVIVDPDGVRQMVGNLLDNALRYAPPGSSVDVRVTPRGSWLDLEVLDRGPGFPTDFLPRAFDRFASAPVPPQRAPSAVAAPDAGGDARTPGDRLNGAAGASTPPGTTGGQGAGLGLAIVRSLARAHGGDASASNRPGGGARVRIRLPLTPVAASYRPPDAPHIVLTSSARESDSGPGRPGPGPSDEDSPQGEVR